MEESPYDIISGAGETEENLEKSQPCERKGLLRNIRIATGFCAYHHVSTSSGLLFPGGT
jgi:hypothetical protein